MIVAVSYCQLHIKIVCRHHNQFAAVVTRGHTEMVGDMSRVTATSASRPV